MTSIKLSEVPLLPLYAYPIVSALSDCIFRSFMTLTILFLNTSFGRVQRMDLSLKSLLKLSCKSYQRRKHLKQCKIPVTRTVKFPAFMQCSAFRNIDPKNTDSQLTDITT